MELDLLGARILVGPVLVVPVPGSGAATGPYAVTEIRSVVGHRRIAVISDTNVAPIHAQPLARALGAPAEDCFNVPAGEASKSRAEWSRLTDAMLARGFGRDTVVLAIGGGVVGDLAGFVAATFMRGVPFIQVPTSLLAMIDAAIGGKTGLDTGAGKNLVGAFHQPLLVIADPRTLETLPPAHFRNGLAEALKHAVITGASELEWLVSRAPRLVGSSGPETAVVAELVERNVRIKIAVVARDEREGGVRKTLNFGHTIGHAIETVSGYSMPHGECVAIGMRAEAMIAQALGLASESFSARVSEGLRALVLPLLPASPMRAEDVLAATRTDKKARDGTVEYALMSEVGAPVDRDTGYGTRVPDEIVVAALARAFAA